MTPKEQDLQQPASEFCAKFDAWIMAQSEPILSETAWAFGVEYGQMRDRLVELNGAVGQPAAAWGEFPVPVEAV